MTEVPDWTHQHATELRNHWWWRPGWRLGRRFHTWHFTFEGQSELHDLVAHYQRGLKGFSNLDLVPEQWLHMTVQGLGFVDELNPDTVQAVSEAVDTRIADLEPLDLVFEHVVVRPEALAMPPSPLAPLLDVKLAIREAIGEVLGREHVPESADNFQPHVSIAYVNAASTAGPIISALDKMTTTPLTVKLARAQLIELHRDQHMYEWTSIN